jgi:hypothetical protein
MTQVVELLSSKCEALSSNFSTTKKLKFKKRTIIDKSTEVYILYVIHISSISGGIPCKPDTHTLPTPSTKALCWHLLICLDKDIDTACLFSPFLL